MQYNYVNVLDIFPYNKLNVIYILAYDLLIKWKLACVYAILT